MNKFLLISTIGLLALSISCTCSRKDGEKDGGKEINQVKKPNLPSDKSKPYKPDYSGITVRRVLTRTMKKSTNTESASSGSQVTVNYGGWIYDPKQGGNKGYKFAGSDSTPYSFTLGKGEVIKGWDQGMMGMKVGEKKQFIIPTELAYGNTGADEVPPGSHVLLEVELIEVN